VRAWQEEGVESHHAVVSLQQRGSTWITLTEPQPTTPS
jgi:hypothetical protein